MIRQRGDNQIGSQFGEQLNAPSFGLAEQINQVQIQDEILNSSRIDDIGRERRSIISEISIPHM